MSDDEGSERLSIMKERSPSKGRQRSPIRASFERFLGRVKRVPQPDDNNNLVVLLGNENPQFPTPKLWRRSRENSSLSARSDPGTMELPTSIRRSPSYTSVANILRTAVENSPLLAPSEPLKSRSPPLGVSLDPGVPSLPPISRNVYVDAPRGLMARRRSGSIKSGAVKPLTPNNGDEPLVHEAMSDDWSPQKQGLGNSDLRWRKDSGTLPHPVPQKPARRAAMSTGGSSSDEGSRGRVIIDQKSITISDQERLSHAEHRRKSFNEEPACHQAVPAPPTAAAHGFVPQTSELPNSSVVPYIKHQNTTPVVHHSSHNPQAFDNNCDSSIETQNTFFTEKPAPHEVAVAQNGDTTAEGEFTLTNNTLPENSVSVPITAATLGDETMAMCKETDFAVKAMPQNVKDCLNKPSSSFFGCEASGGETFYGEASRGNASHDKASNDAFHEPPGIQIEENSNNVAIPPTSNHLATNSREEIPAFTSECYVDGLLPLSSRPASEWFPGYSESFTDSEFAVQMDNATNNEPGYEIYRKPSPEEILPIGVIRADRPNTPPKESLSSSWNILSKLWSHKEDHRSFTEGQELVSLLPPTVNDFGSAIDSPRVTPSISGVQDHMSDAVTLRVAAEEDEATFKSIIPKPKFTRISYPHLDDCNATGATPILQRTSTLELTPLPKDYSVKSRTNPPVFHKTAEAAAPALSRRKQETPKRKESQKQQDGDMDSTNGGRFDPSQLGTRYVRNVPVCQNVPIACCPKKPPLIPIAALLLLFGVVGYFITCLIEMYILNDVVQLPSHTPVNATLYIRNCVTSFARAPPEASTSYVSLRAWLIMQENFSFFNVAALKEPPYNMVTPTHLEAKLKMRTYSRYFQCVVRFYLKEDFVFDQLRVNYEPDVNYVDVRSDIPLKGTSLLSFNVFHAFLQLRSLESPRIRMFLADGKIVFALDGTAYDYDAPDAIVISSREGPVTVEASVPIDVTMPFDVATRAIIRGNGISVTDATADKFTAVVFSDEYSSFSAVFSSVSVQMLGREAPLYLTARTPKENAATLKQHTWIGKEQHSPPHFLPSSLNRFNRIKDWLQQNPNNPWTVVVKLSTEYVPAGLWRFVSSSAYLGKNNWFILFSGGMLSPRKTELKLHMTGLYCRKIDGKPIEDQSGYILTETRDEEVPAIPTPPPAEKSSAPRKLSAARCSTYGACATRDHRQQSMFQAFRRDYLAANKIHFLNYKARTAKLRRLAEESELAPSPGSRPLPVPDADVLPESDLLPVPEANSSSSSGPLPGPGLSPRIRPMSEPGPYSAHGTHGGPGPNVFPGHSDNAKDLLDSRLSAYSLQELWPAPTDPDPQELLRDGFLYEDLEQWYKRSISRSRNYAENGRRGDGHGQVQSSERDQFVALTTNQWQTERQALLATANDFSLQHRQQVRQLSSKLSNPYPSEASSATPQASVPQDAPYYCDGSHTRPYGVTLAPQRTSVGNLGGQALTRILLDDGYGEGGDIDMPGYDIGVSDAPGMCANQILESMFIVFWTTFKAIRASYILPIWRNGTSQEELFFDIQNDAVVKRPTTWSQIWKFSAAIAVNVVISLLVAFAGELGFRKVLQRGYFYHLLTKIPLKVNVSHRLDHEVTKRPIETWKPQISRIYGALDDEGFLIRWCAAYSGLKVTRIAVQIMPVTSGSSEQAPVKLDEESGNLPSEEKTTNVNQVPPVLTKSRQIARQQQALWTRSKQAQSPIFIYFPVSAVKKVETEAGLQSELQVPLIYPPLWKSHRNRILDTDQSWMLSQQMKYRIKLLGVNSVGRIVAESSWSPEVVLADLTHTVDAHKWVLRKLFPAQFSSLAVFLAKHVQQLSPFKLPIVLNDIRLNIITAYGDDARSKHNTLGRRSMLPQDSHSLFTGAGRSTSRQRLHMRQRTLMPAGVSGKQSFSTAGAARWRGGTAFDSNADPSALTEDWSTVPLMITAYLGHKSDVARQGRDRQGRRIWDRVHLGKPIENDDSNLNLGLNTIALPALKSIFLQHDREVQRLVCFDIANSVSGNLVAVGSLSIETLEYELLLQLKSPGPIRITLTAVNGGTEWGALTCSLDPSALRPFVRHIETMQTPSELRLGMEAPESRPQSSAIWPNGNQQRLATRQNTLTSVSGSALQSRRNILGGPGATSFYSAGASLEYGQNFPQNRSEDITNRPCFLRDVPARKHLLGSDIIVQWLWTSPTKPDHIYLQLMDHETDEFILSLHFGRAVPNTGSYSWPVDVQFVKDATTRLVYFVITLDPYTATKDIPVICMSNAFFIVKTLPLSELELAYGAFCRIHGVEMEHMSDAALANHGITTLEKNIRICADLRTPLPFEASNLEVIFCPGQCIVSNTSKLVSLDDRHNFTNTGGSAGAPGGRLLNVTTPTTHQVNVYKSISKKLKVVENCVLDPDPYWWTESPDIPLMQQLFYGFHTIDKLTRWIFETARTNGNKPSMERSWENRTVFDRRRLIIFKLWPTALQSFLLFLGLLMFLMFSGSITCLLILYNYVYTDFVALEHTDVDSVFFSDIVFTRSLSFFFSTPFPLPHVIVIVLFDTVVHIFLLFTTHWLRFHLPRRLGDCTFLYLTVIQYFRIYTVVWVGSSFLMWFLVGALINSDVFLPYAVMLASIVFVVYTLWTNYANSRNLVAKFIEDNLQPLVGLATANWFENMSLEYDDTAQADVGEVRLQFRDQVKRDLKEVRERARREFRLGILTGETSPAALITNDMELGDADDVLTRKQKLRQFYFKFRAIRPQLCTWSYEKFVASPGNSFGFDEEGNPVGLEKELYLPPGSYIASVADAEKNRTALEGLLFGHECAALADGVFYGPRYGYKIKPAKPANRDFTIAFLAVPRYPPAEELDLWTKLAIIFEVFDTEGTGRWTAEAAEQWSAAVGRPIPEELMQYSNDGSIDVGDVEALHQGNPALIDVEYEKLLRSPDDDVDDDSEGRSDRDDSIASDDNYLDDDDDWSSDGEGEGEFHLLNRGDGFDKDGDFEEGDDRDDDDDLEETLKTSLNARKLQTIFSLVTKEHRGKQVDDVLSSTSFLASKVVEVQYRLLSPTFGHEGVLEIESVTTASAKREKSMVYLQNRRSSRLLLHGNNTPNVGNPIFRLLQLIQLELYKELRAACSSIFVQMFAPQVVTEGVSEFHDTVIVDKIQMKTHRLLNARLEIDKKELHPSNVTFFTTGTPKTASQVMRFVEAYRIEHEPELRRQSTILSSKIGAFSLSVEMSFITQVLYHAGVLREDDVCVDALEIISPSGMKSDVNLWVPSRKECYDILLQAIERAARKDPKNFTLPVLLLVTNYMWFDAFVGLVRLLGINITRDELPGAALGDGEKNMEESNSTSDVTLAFTPTPHGEGASENTSAREFSSAREARNLRRISHVFMQLSNNSGFLPVDLADEAILLLTDSRMNFSAVIACLTELGIDSSGMLRGAAGVDVSEQLGLVSPSPIIELTMAGGAADFEKNDDPYDWTLLRRNPGWTQSLTASFNRLTSASPGFMGKSQMIEFIREIRRSFGVEDLRNSNTMVGGGGWTDTGSPRRMEGRNASMHRSVLQQHQLSQYQPQCQQSMISLEVFHRVAVGVGLSTSRKHSAIVWLLLNQSLRRGRQNYVRRFVPAETAFDFLVRAHLQPFDALGNYLPVGEPLTASAEYRGVITFSIFKKILALIGVTVPDKGARGMWDEIVKAPVDVSLLMDQKRLPPGASTTKFLRVSMDPTGMDPTRGFFASIGTVRSQLPRILMTGLWPEALRSLIKLSLQIEVNPLLLEVVLEKSQKKGNRYGLVRPGDIGAILTHLNVAGMTYPMLREIVDKMRLNLPDNRIRAMFNLMDVNHDKSLDLPELIGGFEVLFGKLIPGLVIEAVGVSTEAQLAVIATSLVGLIVFFVFIGLAFSAFVSTSSSASTAMQSLLALGGAISLQSGAKQDAAKVAEGMRRRMETILGDGFDKKLREQQQQSEEAHGRDLDAGGDGKFGGPSGRLANNATQDRPLRLRYTVPRKYRPPPDDPTPCVTFCPGDHVVLIPSIIGRGDKTKITCSIRPRLPPRLGLRFDPATGIIEGIIADATSMELLLQAQQEAARGEKSVEYSEHGSAENANTFRSTTPDPAASLSPEGLGGTVGPPTMLGRRRTKRLQMPCTTFTVFCRNSAGVTRTRVTFQVVPDRREWLSGGHPIGMLRYDDEDNSDDGSGSSSSQGYSGTRRSSLDDSNNNRTPDGFNARASLRKVVPKTTDDDQTMVFVSADTTSELPTATTSPKNTLSTPSNGHRGTHILS